MNHMLHSPIHLLYINLVFFMQIDLDMVNLILRDKVTSI